jgi:hypothetical protein
VLLLVGLSSTLWWRWQPLSAPAVQQPYPAIKIGQTTSQQLQDQVGQPYTEYTDNSYQIQTQQTAKSPYKPDQFYLKNGVVVLKDQWFEPTIYYYAEKDLLQQYGTPEAVMYVTPARDVPIKADLYPSKGVAAYIQNDVKAVWHVQYFRPMSLDTYLSSWGKGLSKDAPAQPFSLEPPSSK